MNPLRLFELNASTSSLIISGEDAATFLQGQTTCDVFAIAEAGGALGALCNPKGRVISLFHLVKHGDDFLMLLPREMSSLIVKRLSMFVFRSKVTIRDASDEFVLLGCANELTTEQIQQLAPIASLPIAPHAQLSILISNKQQFQREQLTDSFSIKQELEPWQEILTSACYPEINTATSELFIPQMLNLDKLNGINFKKGCYTGQEIVARMHYKGSVKRRLVSYQSANKYLAGDDIYQLNTDNSIGTILSSHKSKNSNYAGLAVLKVECIENSPLVLSDNSEVIIQPAEYNLD
ncbi:MAG: folate-binding protein [Cycloclasticus sp.]